MDILGNLKETAVSVLPVMAIVLLLGLTVAPLDAALLGRFAIGGALLVVGLAVFLLGVGLGIQPMGSGFGAKLTARRSLALMLGAAFAVGFIVTASEPDIQVFASQVRGVFPGVGKLPLTFAIAGGVGLFMVVGLLRTLLRLPIKAVLSISYALLFAASCAAHPAFIGIGFDSGGATTGPMTVPFIMALGLGVSAVRADPNGSFGLTGIASVGPVLAVLLYSMALRDGAAAEAAAPAAEEVSAAASFLAPFGHAFGEALRESAVSIVPLFALFVIAQFTLLRLPPRQFMRLATGFVYAFAGLAVFLAGVNGGFMQAGRALGEQLGRNALQSGGAWYALLIGTGLALSAIIVCAEPAVWVLSEQVEQVSGGMIRRKALLVFLSIGTALAIGLAMWRAAAGFPLWWILLPGYAVAMALMAFAPPLFAGIAFDSGGVASGPLTSTFVLSFTLGAASGGAGGTDAFGVIALVAMMPLVAIQIMGILYERRRRRALAAPRPEGDGQWARN